MKSRLNRLTEFLRKYDRDLFAYRNIEGKTLIMRKVNKDFLIEDDDSLPRSQMILALTEDWTGRTAPKDWGLEPIYQKLSSMDAWRDEQWLKKDQERREMRERDKERVRRNDIRARAADLRKDFARATNDINTSTLEKVDHRRMTDGNC